MGKSSTSSCGLRGIYIFFTLLSGKPSRWLTDCCLTKPMFHSHTIYVNVALRCGICVTVCHAAQAARTQCHHTRSHFLESVFASSRIKRVRIPIHSCGKRAKSNETYGSCVHCCAPPMNPYLSVCLSVKPLISESDPKELSSSMWLLLIVRILLVSTDWRPFSILAMLARKLTG